MEWSDTLATGIAEIDAQHRALFDWLAELETAAAEERIKATLYALTRLSQYVKAHFAAEEKLLVACAYPGLDAHRAEHAAFCAQLAELRTRAATHDVSELTVALLRDWLRQHIMCVDMDYVPYLDRR